MNINFEKIIKIALFLFLIFVAIRFVIYIIPFIFALIAIYYGINWFKNRMYKKGDSFNYGNKNINYDDEHYNMTYYTKEKENEEFITSKPTSVKDADFFRRQHEVKDVEIIEE